MKRILFMLIGVSIVILGLVVVSNRTPAHTQNIVEVGPVDVVLLLPEGESDNNDLISRIGPTRTTTNPLAALTLVTRQTPNAVVIHKDALDGVDKEWLRELYDGGIVIGAVNLTRTELKQFLGIPTSETEVLPETVTPPYMSYVYERGNQEEEGWYQSGSGLALLQEPREFVEYVQRVEAATATNRFHREQAEPQQ